MNFILLLLPSLLSALLAYLVRPYRAAVGWVMPGSRSYRWARRWRLRQRFWPGVKRRPSARVSCCALIASLRC